ncbi:hypothetical protein DINM_002068 [Dirofilaria immitis]|nr:hypothetical protein [Dirofilaria immitis]
MVVNPNNSNFQQAALALFDIGSQLSFVSDDLTDRYRSILKSKIGRLQGQPVTYDDEKALEQHKQSIIKEIYQEQTELNPQKETALDSFGRRISKDRVNGSDNNTVQTISSKLMKEEHFLGLNYNRGR